MNEHSDNPGGSGVRRIPVVDRRRVRFDSPLPEPPQAESHPQDLPPGGAGGQAPEESPAGPGGPTVEAAVGAQVEAAEPPLEEQLQKSRAEAAEHLEDLQRLQAEFSNYRKRILKEQTEMVERASANLIHRLLPVLDNFLLAVAAAEGTRDFDRMLRGVEMVFGELNHVLSAEGLKPIEAKGRPFDPNLHEAALELPGDEEGEPVVAEVLRPGYMLRDRVLRPAMVKVVRRRVEEET